MTSPEPAPRGTHRIGQPALRAAARSLPSSGPLQELRSQNPLEEGTEGLETGRQERSTGVAPSRGTKGYGEEAALGSVNLKLISSAGKPDN